MFSELFPKFNNLPTCDFSLFSIKFSSKTEQ